MMLSSAVLLLARIKVKIHGVHVENWHDALVCFGIVLLIPCVTLASAASASQAVPDGGPGIMSFVRCALLGAVVLFLLFIGRKVFASSTDNPNRKDVSAGANGSVTFDKIPAGGAMEMLQKAFEVNKPPRPKTEDGELAFLNAGEDGIVRLALQKKQRKVIADLAKCRLFLPDGWNEVPEVESRGPFDVLAKFAGPGSHEAVTVEHVFLSPEHANDDLGDWVNASRMLFGRAVLQLHTSKASGVSESKELAFGRLNRRDSHYMTYHQADDMAAFAGTIEIEESLCRLFIVILRRGRDSWKFEYVFPAASEVSRESLGFRPEEIVAAARIFVPIETHGRAKCPLCGTGMDDPPVGKPIDGLTVEMKDFTLFDGGPKIRKAGMTLACCVPCMDKLEAAGIDLKTLKAIPDIKAQLDKGASIAAVKCGGRSVAMHGA